MCIRDSPDTERLSISYMSSHPQLYQQLANSPENIANMKKIEQSLSGITQNISIMSRTPTAGVSGFTLFLYISIRLDPVAKCLLS